MMIKSFKICFFNLINIVFFKVNKIVCQKKITIFFVKNCVLGINNILYQFVLK